MKFLYYCFIWIIVLVLIIPALPILLLLYYLEADVSELWEMLSFKTWRDRELITQKGFTTFGAIVDMLVNIDSIKNLNTYQIAFYQGEHSNPKDCMPLRVSKNMKHLSYKQKVNKTERGKLEFEKIESNIIMLNPIKSSTSLFEKNIKYTAEKDYIYNILTSFKDEVLERQIQFFGKFGIFDNVDFIMLNKTTGFKFIGKYRTTSAVVNNGDIFYCKSMVFNEE